MPGEPASQSELFYRFGAALLIGALIGLQREQSNSGGEEIFAGVRTFAIVGIAGCGAGLAASELGAPIIFASMLIVIGGLLIAAYVLTNRKGGIGLTSEVALLTTLICGGLAAWGYSGLAAAVGVATAGLLALKPTLHQLARRISAVDMQAALTLGAISLIVLPLLPNQPIGAAPLDVINPQKIWLLVVLISSLSFSGYGLHKLIGPQRGIALTGLLGGIVSSTAVTLSSTQRARAEPTLSGSYGLAIVIAWTVMFIRVALLVGALNRPLLGVLWPMLLAGGGAGLGWCAVLSLRREPGAPSGMVFGNPLELRAAIGFGLLYTGILVGANLARAAFGDAGVYLSSLLAGLADVDAIALSLSELAGEGGIDLPTAARAVGLALLANTLVKGGIVVASGPAELRRAVVPAMLLISLGGAAAAIWGLG